jgi:hypothetical protein
MIITRADVETAIRLADAYFGLRSLPDKSAYYEYQEYVDEASRENAYVPAYPTVRSKWLAEDPNRLALHFFLMGLSGSELDELIALMHLGRGDFPYSPAEWDARLKSYPWQYLEGRVIYLMSNAFLAPYLQEGLNRLSAMDDEGRRTNGSTGSP